ncbi:MULTISPECIES: hypothetical protein [Thermodesulfovibrio]|jgi:hypothetical protein|uniref:hypothetical protein n=1 Tax=Thermodesulfovibrio TaxID=28261 RepID=UPI0026261448|nr:hypothetical protein [Thermodesulfovibrio sp.]
MKFVTIFFCIFLLIFSINVFAETPSSKTKLGQQEDSAISSIIFKCEGYLLKTPGHIDSEKPKSANENPEGKKDYKPRYLLWSCPHQKSVEKPFNELYIPVKPKSTSVIESDSTNDHLTFPEMEKLQKKISMTASKTLNRNCTCNFYYEGKYNKKPLINCQCSGAYKEPPLTDPVTGKPIK